MPSVPKENIRARKVTAGTVDWALFDEGTFQAEVRPLLGLFESMLSKPRKRSGVGVTLFAAESFVALAGVGFAAHRSLRAEAGFELFALLAGLLICALVLLVGAIVQFRRREVDSGTIALFFVFVAMMIGWEVASRASRAEN